VTNSSEGRYYLQIIGPQDVELWQRRKRGNKRVAIWRSSLVEIRTAQFSPDGKTIAVGGRSSTETPIEYFQTQVEGT
jgi:hypothetical protein